MKTIVTHFNPDLDAVAAVWVVKRFFEGWREAKIKFVPAGETYQKMPVDSHHEILHVDTGLGEFDHHQTNDYLCAAQLCWQKIKDLHAGKADQRPKTKDLDNEAIERLLDVVLEVDHGRDVVWPGAENDRYLFFLEEILGGLNSVYQDDLKAVEFGLKALDGIFKILKDRIRAEEILEGPRVVKFETQWGAGVGATTGNEAILELGERKGFSVVVKKDTKTGHVRIYARWDRGVDLTQTFHKLKEADSQATWFLHSSKCLLLNGSPRNPMMRPSRLSLKEIIEVLRKEA